MREGGRECVCEERSVRKGRRVCEGRREGVCARMRVRVRMCEC